ncbi:IS30 family transposase [Enterococcus sp. PF1-24]|uniref:IS30 family transposase n=1 Tax=unclassified Enterococcus TaxID=2608891 RepID=UPI002474FE90|nr:MULTISPECIES: IS30 family transposase [unclassified Enterococcus]MDH6365847.1 IS30 family transposase [Enterococcus sp. PFB1-1]MDH6402941.1 IS30 family transposase [Enterococcus sp. PF1-24]
MTYKHLSPEERGKIEAYLDEGLSHSEIAKRLDRHRSTIHREIKRNSEQRKSNSIAALRYQATSANNVAKMRKKNCGASTKATIHNTQIILKYLNKKYSPEQIAHSIKSVKVCTRTIYNWIYFGIIKFDIKKLRQKGKRFKRKAVGRKLRRPDASFYTDRTIDLRPSGIDSRSEFGHWEADTVVSKQGINACLATFVERKTRQYIAIKIPRKDAVSMMKAINQLIKMYPKGIKSITCDRGTEFVNRFKVGTIEDTFGIKVYFAHPYAPHERGSNEYHNGLLREYFPKPSNFNRVTQEDINQATNYLNNRPRKNLKWKTPQYRFNLEYAKL